GGGELRGRRARGQLARASPGVPGAGPRGRPGGAVLRAGGSGSPVGPASPGRVDGDRHPPGRIVKDRDAVSPPAGILRLKGEAPAAPLERSGLLHFFTCLFAVARGIPRERGDPDAARPTRGWTDHAGPIPATP